MEIQGAISRREIWVDMLLYPRHTLPTAFAPALIAGGLAYHNHVFHPIVLFSAFMAGWLIQLGGVIADNYNNFTHHPDDKEHAKFAAGLRAGVVTLTELRASIIVCYLVAMLFGIYLVLVSGLLVVAIGIVSIIASLAYSSKPYPLGDHAFGEPLFYLFFGPISLIGCYYVQAAAMDSQSAFMPLVLWISLGVAALTTNILVIDNIRDMDFDKAKNEITIAVLIGRKWSFVEYVLFLVSAYIIPFALWKLGEFGVLIFLPYLSIPYGAIVASRLIRSKTFEERIPLTPQAGQTLLLYSALLTLSIAFSG